jgi:hypothetical protein
MGMMGLTAGASTAGILGILRLMGDHWLPRMASNSDHKHQMTASLQGQRHETLQRWRAGLATARDTYREWAAGPRTHDAPNAVGDEWFEGLRPHLPDAGEAAEFRSAHEIHCDNETVVSLSLEIGRIERQWVDEAKGFGRRGRKS